MYERYKKCIDTDHVKKLSGPVEYELPLILVGEVEEEDNIVDVIVEDNNTVNITLDESISINVVSGEEYDGEYVVIPHTRDDIILPTRQKVMTRDVTVKKVPYFETSNTSGITVYIGSEA